ncbi:MAG: imidazoleglycerol-phosphate dehydratase HisB [Anaerolineae bacterium]|jgi:imidazoleglycerol-phosphate dehydratase|nr:imidazoleglycerol-phosphate dehydratase HisB [Anaerolineae bacterium]MDH7473281.1 imidazoleglycerol-phosphate dehydratase HisB [Anaerolineae bacterium]
MTMRSATIHRQTAETDVHLTLSLDGTGQYQGETGLGFLDHMLAHVAVHGLFDLTVRVRGDLHVDPHHTVEDVALALGQALDQALGDRAGIVRIGAAHVPMDEALAFVAVDLSGRPYAVTEMTWSGPTVGGLPVTLIPHFFESLAVAARANVHACLLYGRDDHHQAEALFKALGRALDAATRLDPRRGAAIPSTKGRLV